MTAHLFSSTPHRGSSYCHRNLQHKNSNNGRTCSLGNDISEDIFEGDEPEDISLTSHLVGSEAASWMIVGMENTLFKWLMEIRVKSLHPAIIQLWEVIVHPFWIQKLKLFLKGVRARIIILLPRTISVSALRIDYARLVKIISICSIGYEHSNILPVLEVSHSYTKYFSM